MPKLKFIDLFAGIGGTRLAAEANGLKCVFSSEIDNHCQQTYAANFGDMPSGDITKIPTSVIPNFDLLIAGFPCQPFSYAGDSLGLKDRRGNLFFELVRILKEKKPKAFLFENVKGLVSHDNGKTLKIIERELNNIGYSFKWEILNSNDFGLPQNRERWYCVGFDTKKKINLFNFPQKKIQPKKLIDIIDKSLKDPSLKISELWQKRINWHFENIHEERVKHHDFGDKGSKRTQHGVFSFLKTDNSIRFHMGDFKKTQIQEGYFISTESDTAPTLIAGRVPQLWDLKRKLSVKECARLQGFPDNYKFISPNSQSYKQLGNSVSVPVVKLIVKEICKILENSQNKNQKIEKQLDF